MKCFVVYPHCYIRTTTDEVIIINPDTKSNCNTDIAEIVLLFCENGYCVPITDNYDVNQFINECISHDLGYIVGYDNIPPYHPKSSFNITSSKQKINKALGYHNGNMVNNLVGYITLNFNNILLAKFSREELMQVGYPLTVSNNKISYDSFIDNNTFPNVQFWVLCGDVIDKDLLRHIKILYCAYPIKVRTVYVPEYKSTILDLLEEYKLLNFELLVTSCFEIGDEITMYGDRVTIIKLLTCLGGLSEQYNNYLPILSHVDLDIELISEMLIDKSDIVESASRKLGDIVYNEFYNKNRFGKLEVHSNMDVYSGSMYIGNYGKTPLIDLINAWMNNPENNWIQSRIKKKECRQCIYASLCPSITIYEELGFVEKACND